MYRDQFGELERGYWGLNDQAASYEKGIWKLLYQRAMKWTFDTKDEV